MTGGGFAATTARRSLFVSSLSSHLQAPSPSVARSRMPTAPPGTAARPVSSPAGPVTNITGRPSTESEAVLAKDRQDEASLHPLRKAATRGIRESRRQGG